MAYNLKTKEEWGKESTVLKKRENQLKITEKRQSL